MWYDKIPDLAVRERYKKEEEEKLKEKLRNEYKLKLEVEQEFNELQNKEKLLNIKKCSQCGASIKSTESIYCEYCKSKLI